MQIPATVLALVTIFRFFAAAQTITVDVSHSTNHFVPSETLGAGVDRIPAELPPAVPPAGGRGRR